MLSSITPSASASLCSVDIEEERYAEAVSSVAVEVTDESSANECERLALRAAVECASAALVAIAAAPNGVVGLVSAGVAGVRCGLALETTLACYDER
jgi:hypothetical protein